MMRRLPVGNYKWKKASDFSTVFNKNNDFNQDKGYICCVDLEYPQELHDLHNDYPLAPEKTTPTLSPYMKGISEELKYKSLNCVKLVNTLSNKKDYVVHGSLLQFYLDQGMKITKINKVVSFTQKDFLKPYVSYNTEKRIEAMMNKNTNESLASS